MKPLFAFFTRLSLRFRFVTVAAIVAVMALGAVAWSQLKQELLPSIEFPSTFILAQASGMSSEQVLNVLTSRIEAELAELPDIVNIESTTTGAFGAFITASNDFGISQERLRDEIQDVLDSIWLPVRRLQPPAGEDSVAFAARLLADVPADLLIYIAEEDPNFLFQLSPEVWQQLSDETIQEVLAYLANQLDTGDSTKNALQRLVEQEVLPQLRTLDVVANAQVRGGQVLPGDEGAVDVALADVEPKSLLLNLSPQVWEVIANKLDVGELNDEAVAQFSSLDYTIPDAPPALPDSWQQAHFSNVTDLLEIGGGITRTVAAVLNDFVLEGEIVGALGQTDDLSPEIIQQMLEIDPTLVQYFEAKHLAAMSPEVFAALPDEYIDNLDGFTRDALAAAALAKSVTGRSVEPPPVPLPSAWRIQPPQIITFSFADIPVAVFNVFSTQDASASTSDTTPEETTSTATPTETPNDESAQTEPQQAEDIPEGPALPQILNLIASSFMGLELDTADDLIAIQLPPELAEQLGTDTLSGSLFLNAMANPEQLAAFSGGEGGDAGGFDLTAFDTQELVAALGECEVGLFDLAGGNVDFGQILLGCISTDAYAFIAEHDPTFVSSLDPAVFDRLPDEVLQLAAYAPPLDDVWNTLAQQPELGDMPLRTAADIVALGDGSAAQVLNTINNSVPARFEGYEVRLFDSLTPAILRYFSIHEPNFYENLDSAVLLKLSAETIAALPAEVIAAQDESVAEQLNAIASGEMSSAAAALAELYATDVPPADPDAPALNDMWQFVGAFYNIELDTADDFFRFPSNFPFTGPTDFMNSIFSSPQGAAAAPQLFGGLTIEAIEYITERDPEWLNRLDARGLQNLSEDVLAALPQSVQDRAVSGDEVFIPTAAITRMNGGASLQLTVFKSAESNTVEAYDQIKAVLDDINERNEDIDIAVAFETASFVRQSIEGVVREGTLGAVFAIIVILIFLSGGTWKARSRRMAGFTMVFGFAAVFVVLLVSNLGAAGGDVKAAFDSMDTVVRVLLLLGFIAGLIALVPGIHLPEPSVRSTLVIAVSIPLSIFATFALMAWLPPVIHAALGGMADQPIVAFILRLFPTDLTLNLMTLSGITVAVGRIVDDSIVVLENIFRQMQSGQSKREAILEGTRDVSQAIFSATLIAVVVFLPLGLTGGIVSEFFLPFGLAVTYALMSSFVVAITVVPVLASFFIDVDQIPEEQESSLQRLYVPVLRWSLARNFNKWVVIALAIVSMIIGQLLLVSRPFAFLPEFGEPQISVNVSMPPGTRITETDALVREFEAAINEQFADEITTVQVVIGQGGLGFDTLLGGASISENIANVALGIRDRETLDDLTRRIREEIAIPIFGEENVTVSGGSLTDSGFGGFEVVVSGADQQTLEAYNDLIIETLSNVEGLANVTSSLDSVGESGDGPQTFIRINGQAALSYSAELETEDTFGVTAKAIEAIESLEELPDGIQVTQGFDSQMQTEGFEGLVKAIAIAIVIIMVILVFTFNSLIYWIALMFSLVVAPFGAALALTITDRQLNVSAMIGLLMLLGIVITNAVVLIDRVSSNRKERGMNLHDALMEAGSRRMRPIFMTALATIIALVPLAVGLSEGAIIAAEMGTAVIGGALSSTLLTLIVVPVAYSLLSPIHDRLTRVVRRQPEPTEVSAD